MRIPIKATAAALAAGALLTACGDEDKQATAPDKTAIEDGAVVYSDSFDNNRNGWLTVEKLVFMRKGEYHWLETPEGGGNSLPDTMLEEPLPAGVATSIDVEMTSGAALRGLTCREVETGAEGERTDWYELGIDGRRALVRRMAATEPPKVLASAEVPIANGERVRLTARCVPDGESVVLSLSTDGREVVRATDADGISGKPGTVAVFGYARPDSDGPANMVWDDFEVRAATLA